MCADAEVSPFLINLQGQLKLPHQLGKSWHPARRHAVICDQAIEALLSSVATPPAASDRCPVLPSRAMTPSESACMQATGDGHEGPGDAPPPPRDVMSTVMTSTSPNLNDSSGAEAMYTGISLTYRANYSAENISGNLDSEYL